MCRRSILCLAVWLSLRPASLPAGEPAAFVDRYGDLLPPRAVARLGANRLRHAGVAMFPALVYSPDGRLLALAGEQCAYVWQTRSGRLLHLLTGHGGRVMSVAFSPDSEILATAGEDGTIRLWQVSSGRLLRRWKAHPSWIRTIAFSPDGKIIASGASGELVRLWDAATGRALRSLQTGMGHVMAVVFAPDGKTLAAGDESIQLWDMATGAKRATWEGDGCISSLRFAPDGKSLAAGNLSKTVRLLDVATVKPRHTFQLDGIHAVAFAPDGKTLAGAGRDGMVLWDTASGKSRRAIKPPSCVSGITFSPEGRTLASVYCYGTSCVVSLWDPATGEDMTPLLGHFFPINTVAWSADGTKLLTDDRDGEVRLWDAATARPLGIVPNQPNGLKTLPVVIEGKKFLPNEAHNGRLLAQVDKQENIRLVERKTGAEVACFAGNQGGILSLAFAPDGKTLASTGMDGTILLWDVTGSRRPAPLVLSDKELQTLWDVLADSDARTAQDAIWRLAAVPERSVPFLAERVRPIPPLSADRIHHLITELDDDHFAVRERATRELAALGRRAEPAMRQTLKHRPSLEVRRRVEQLLPQLRGLSPKELQAVRSVRVLDQVNTPGAERLLRSLAGGAEGTPRTEEARAALRRREGRTSALR